MASLPPVEQIATHIETVARLAADALSRTVIDRDSPDAAAHAAVAALLGWQLTQARCVLGGLKSEAPQGISPNVRSMLETLVTALYLIDPKANESEREDRLERYYRGTRREQVRLRSGLDAFPNLRNVFLIDPALADREKAEYDELEVKLPADKKLGRRHWSGKQEGLKAIADAVGLASDYAVDYRVTSGSIHANRPWDTARFEDSGLLIIPSPDGHRDMAIPLAFNALRYLAWLLREAVRADAVTLYRSELEVLSKYEQYMESLEILFAKGIVGPPPTPASPSSDST